MTLESIKIGISGMFLSNSRFSSSSLLWDIGISERFCIKNVLFWGDDTNPSIFLVLPHRVSVFSSFFLGRGWVRLSSFFASFLVSTTCQVGHFDSHTFWFLIEFFIENLVLTGGRYTRFPLKLDFKYTFSSKVSQEFSEALLQIKYSLIKINKLKKKWL